MKKYELLCVIKPNLDMDNVDQVVKNLEETIKNYGGSVLNTDKMGRKKLAYELKGFKDGFYATMNIELPSNKVVDLKRHLKLNENFIRDLILDNSKTKAAVAK